MANTNMRSQECSVIESTQWQRRQRAVAGSGVSFGGGDPRRALVTSRDEEKVVLGRGGGSPRCVEKVPESRVRGNRLDRLILIFDGLLLFCKGLFQLRNGLALSGNLQILLRVLLLLSPNSFFLLLKSLHHFCLEIVKQLFHPLLLLRDASFKAFPWWLHTFAHLEVGISLNGTIENILLDKIVKTF